MIWTRWVWLPTAAFLVSAPLIVSGCSGSPAAPTSVPATASQLADAGKAVFANKCTACHGFDGQGVTGPALIGSNASYGSFSTAQDLMKFISTAMPADQPGGLTAQEYLQVTTYLLVRNKIVQPSATISNLGSIEIK